MTRRLPHAPRRHASHLPTRTQLVFPLRPPDPPTTPAPPTPPTPGPSKSVIPPPRIDYARLLADPQHTTSNHVLRASGLSPQHVAHIARLRSTRSVLLGKLNTIRAKQNEISELIKSSLTDREEMVRQARKLKVRVGEYETNLSATEDECLELALALPNFSDDEVPPGREPRVIETFGPEPRPQDTRRDHLGIAQKWELVDTEASGTVTGSSWPYLRGALALLEQAVIQYALSVVLRQGYTPVSPPDAIKDDIAWRCGFQPRQTDSAQTYSLSNTDLVLAGTAEIPLVGMFANQTLDHLEGRPRKVVGVGKAYRAEAGARGADTRGLYRVHWFNKVEMVVVCAEAESRAIMDEMRGIQREVARGLGLAVRVMDMPNEELGASASRKYDMESWMPGRGSWGEITSLSNCTDYQSRRLHIRYRPSQTSDEQPASLQFAHTLNGTAAAVPRLLVAMLENGVKLNEAGQPEGLELPSVLLRFWVGGGEVGRGVPIHWV